MCPMHDEWIINIASTCVFIPNSDAINAETACWYQISYEVFMESRCQ